MESDNATHYKTHPSDWRCQNCGAPQRDRGLGVQRGNLVNRKVSFRNNKDPVCFCCQKTRACWSSISQSPRRSQRRNLAPAALMTRPVGHVPKAILLLFRSRHKVAGYVCMYGAGWSVATEHLFLVVWGDTHLVPIQTPPAPSLGGWGGTSSRAKDMPLLTGIRKQVLAPAIGVSFLNDVQPSASKRHGRAVDGGERKRSESLPSRHCLSRRLEDLQIAGNTRD